MALVLTNWFSFQICKISQKLSSFSEWMETAFLMPILCMGIDFRNLKTWICNSTKSGSFAFPQEIMHHDYIPYICNRTSFQVCSITPETANIGSSYNRMRCPGVGCWFSDRSNCSHWSLTLTFTVTSENLLLYTTPLLLLVLIQLFNPRCWHLDSNYCPTRCRQSQLRFVLSPLLLHPQQSSVCWSTFYVQVNSLYLYRWWLVNSFNIDTSF